ncbi:MAG: hypothetical protein QF654_10750 [Alphaproteobacteria bacterium]|jgi:hypothetical protein|nr:hypothetical protein [Alphaproteobacteria bacterium]
MNRAITAFGALLVCVAAMMSPTVAKAAAQNPTILIMAEDADADGVPRKSRISTRILNELVTQMHSEGFDVYDETAVTLDTHKQGRSRRTDAELVDIARSVRKPPIDVVVFFTVFASTTRKTYTNELNLRVVGRLLSTHDGRRLGNWEDSVPKRWSLPNRCFPEGRGVSRDCLLEAVGDDAKIIAREVGSILVEKLEHQLGSRGGVSRRGKEGLKKGYTLVFDGFDTRDMRDIEEYLVIFSGYIDHRPTREHSKFHELWYESTITTTKLQRNLHKMMELLDIPYTMKFAGNAYTIRNKMMRKERPHPGRDSKYKW